jgi:hypothetical protein
MERSEQICAVIDIQGFFVDKVFYPRELAIVNDKYQLCLEIDSQITEENKMSNYRHFSFQTNYIHGIPVDKVIDEKTLRIITIDKLKNFICDLYNLIKTDNKFYFGIKNQQLSKLLDEYELPYVNLETESIGYEYCPTLKLFDSVCNNRHAYCLLHSLLHKTQIDEKIRCSLRKCVNIWNWLSFKLNSDQLVKQIFNLEDV